MQTLADLEKKEKLLLKKASAEVEKAKQYTKAKNKRGIDLRSTSLWFFLSDFSCHFYILNVVFFMAIVQRQYNVWRKRSFMNNKLEILQMLNCVFMIRWLYFYDFQFTFIFSSTVMLNIYMYDVITDYHDRGCKIYRWYCGCFKNRRSGNEGNAEGSVSSRFYIQHTPH